MSKVVLTAAVSAALLFSASAPVVDGKVRRPARLFVAGQYPDKGVAISPEDIAGIVARFNEAGTPVPVLTEHQAGLHDPLGQVVALHVEGGELWGMLCFSEGTDAHLRERGITRCSVGLVRPDEGGFALKEVSMTERPRVPGAGLLTPEQVGEKVAEFRAAGKLTPAMETPLRRLLAAPAVLTFDDGTALDVTRETLALLSALPIVQPRGGAVPGSAATALFAAFLPPAPITDTTRTVCARLGVDPARVAAALSTAAAEKEN
jgi:hypothetical protein